MKIIIVHYRYYEASGPEKYLFAISQLLKDKGHVVIPFSLKYANNKQSDYSKYFPKPLVSNFHINEKKETLTHYEKVKIINDSFFNKKAYHSLSRLIENTKPDIAYVLQYGTKLSTSIFDALYKYNIPVILRLSDFNLICAKNTMFRNGNICTKCVLHKSYSVIHRCVHGSLAQSFIYYWIQKYNSVRHFERKIDAFVTPSNFTLNLLKGTKQFGNSKFFHIPTFANYIQEENIQRDAKLKINEGLRLCYVGRIADDKGIDLMIEAIYYLSTKEINVSLDIYGENNSEYAVVMKQKAHAYGLKNIQFKGFVSSEKINQIYPKYHFSIIPSKWFDNMPNSLIESCMNGIPVIASRIGSLQELVKDDFNGYTFEPFCHECLATVISSCAIIDETKYEILSMNSRKWVIDYCDKDTHYNSLFNVMNEVIYEKNS